ncbi:MAG TPA: non-ribosomal peptide synthetase, partial [Herpetosiphonaceae bacterium]
TFLATCAAWRISLLSLPTTFWHELVAQMDADALVLPTSLRLVTFGGDRANPERVALWQQHADEHVQLVNTYGPTESTIIATLFSIPPTALERGFRDVPIGRPLRNLTAYVLDQHLALVPVGVPGELCLGGAGLARGYLDRPALTAERFVPDPFSQRPGARIYHTGDLVRWLPDGTLEFLGRVDYQVKIRGFRVEVGEVEAALHQCPAVSDAVVVAREDTSPASGYPDKRLVAYIIPRDGHTPTTSELRSFLLAKIPDYMIPTAFITLERLPLTTGGKVNRRALPAPDQTRPNLNDAFAEPRTPTEQQVASIWRSVLKLEQVGIDDNFFDLGGHSLLATQVIARLRDMFQVDLPIRYLFAAPTVSGVAAMIERMRWLAQDASGSAADDESAEEGAL